MTPTLVGHYVIESTTTPSKCSDGGTTYSAITVQILGTVLDTSGNIILRIGN